MTEGAHFRGRPVSWLAVVIILVGFAVGGLALVLGQWWLFWVGVGVVVVGGILAVAIDIFADVALDPLHQSEAEPHVSPVKHEVAGEPAERLEPVLPGDGPQIDATGPIEGAGTPSERDSSTASS